MTIAISNNKNATAELAIELAALQLNRDETLLLQQKRMDHRRLQALIVEDHDFLRQLMYEALRPDHDVHKAVNLKEGLELYLQFAPHIIFLDIGLPDGSGHQLARKLKEIDPHCYVVMVTNNQKLQDIKAASENGVDGYIIKPFNRTKIEEAISRYMTIKPPGLNLHR